ncbi:hypothetical protein D3C72_1648420 [compost metagenome]
MERPQLLHGQRRGVGQSAVAERANRDGGHVFRCQCQALDARRVTAASRHVESSLWSRPLVRWCRSVRPTQWSCHAVRARTATPTKTVKSRRRQTVTLSQDRSREILKLPKCMMSPFGALLRNGCLNLGLPLFLCESRGNGFCTMFSLGTAGTDINLLVGYCRFTGILNKRPLASIFNVPKVDLPGKGVPPMTRTVPFEVSSMMRTRSETVWAASIGPSS